jgi:hypothetical protein
MEYVNPALEFLGSAAGLGWAALVAVLIVHWIGKRNEVLEGFVYAAFLAAEKAIPDGTAGGLGKLDTFLQEFRDRYRDRYGKDPSTAWETWARAKVEKLVYEAKLAKAAGTLTVADGGLPPLGFGG